MKAKNFSLMDQHNTAFTLSDFRGRKVLLSFHPLAWTDICAAQMKSLEKHRKLFEKLNTVSVGISVDSVPCKHAWARSLRVKDTRLLSDFWPHGKVAKSFGILRDREGFSERAIIVLDEKGSALFVKIYPIPHVPELSKIIEVLQRE